MIARPFLLRRLRELTAPDEDAADALERDGILTLADFDLAAAEQRPAATGAPTERAVAAIRRDLRPLTLGRAWEVAASAIAAIRTQCPEISGLEPSGAIRRGEPLVPGLIIVAHGGDPVRVIQRLADAAAPSSVLHRGPRRLILLFEGQEIDIRISPRDEYARVLFTTTGPGAHVAAVLKGRGSRLVSSEAELYGHAGLAYLPPETRDAPDAIARATAHAVPRLVERGDIRGDLHMHTDFSDGRDSLREMVRAAHALGYEYAAITDHSENASASRTLRIEQISRQRDEIFRLRDEVNGMTILHGMEVDILPDGSLDCPDAVLETLDIVLASLHEQSGHDRRRLTKRCLAAIHHPLVSIITHPSNQLVGRRPGYDMDYPAIYAAAAETGTALEVDGGPAHLDLSGERAAEAVRAGVTLVIDSDCHRADALDRQMRMGLATARRGWVEPRHVLNTGGLAAVRAFVARKRAR